MNSSISNFQSKLCGLLDGSTYNSTSRFIEYFIVVVVILNVLMIILESVNEISLLYSSFFYNFEVFSVIVFTIEYIARVWSYGAKYKAEGKHWKGRKEYIFSFYGLIDFLAVIPYYLSSIDLRFLRAFRVFRIFRAFKLIRYNKALNRFQIAYRIVKEELMLFLVVIVILLFIVSAGIYFFENQAQPDVFKSIFHSSWWSIVTLTTVGYGDVYPITLGGKIFTFFVLIIGVGVVTVPAGLVATALSKAREIQENEENN